MTLNCLNLCAVLIFIIILYSVPGFASMPTSSAKTIETGPVQATPINTVYKSSLNDWAPPGASFTNRSISRIMFRLCLHPLPHRINCSFTFAFCIPLSWGSEYNGNSGQGRGGRLLEAWRLKNNGERTFKESFF